MKCPKCNNENLLRFSTLNLLTCTDCCIDIQWKLKENKKPIITSSRDKNEIKTKILPT